jgi:chloramphenicol-sensitive protein RarD
MSKGTLSAAAAYLIWGFFPIYFKALDVVPAFQIMTHRIVWSFLFLLILISVLKRGKTLRASLTPKIILIYLGAGFLLAINWVVYAYGVTSGQIVEASLGYFINPLVSVLLGVIILHERLRLPQWIAIILAAVGVAFLTISFGKLPWIALVLALSFGTYGLVKKIAPLGSLDGITLETTLLFLPALLYLLVVTWNGNSAYTSNGFWIAVTLTISGVVTIIPLLLFAAGARATPLVTIGLLQFFTPTMQFLLGVFLYHEPFDSTKAVGFVIIWTALIIFILESLVRNHKHSVQAATQP